MKAKRWPIWSAALNVLLGVTIVGLAVHPVKKDRPAGAQTSSPLASSAAPPLTGPAPLPAGDGTWRQWLGPLRAGGVPDNVLAGLVAADFEDRWQRQQRELQQRYQRGEIDDDTITRFVEVHDADREQELRFALGADGYERWDKQNVLRALQADKVTLSSSEADALYRLKKDLARQEADLVKAHQAGEIDETDLDQRQVAAEKDYEARAKSLLGDARYTTWKTPEDAGCGEMARALNALAATKPQSEAVLAVRQQWDRQHADLEKQQDQMGKDAYDQKMQAINAARDAEYRRILGDADFAQLQAAQDGRYRAMQHYAAAWRLDGTDVDYVYNALQQSQKTIQDYQQRARQLEGLGQAVDWPAVDANIQAYSRQTQQLLHEYLGDDRFNQMVKNSILEF